MSIKMRYLYASGKKKFVTIGDIIKEKFSLANNNNAVDVIPPAYSCDKERMVFIGLSPIDGIPFFKCLSTCILQENAPLIKTKREYL